MRIVIPTTGSLGDIQPYAALGVGLQAAGFAVRLATHADFAQYVRSRGLDFVPIEASARSLHQDDIGRRMAAAGGNPFAFLRDFALLRQPLMLDLMAATLRACRDADAVLVAGTAPLIGRSVAERLRLPVVAACLQPVNPSRFLASSLFPAWPAGLPLRTLYNWVSHLVAAEFLWQMVRASVNEARRAVLGLPPLPFLGPRDLFDGVPTLHGYSPVVVPRPADWGANHHLTGYWFLNRPADWRPPARLLDFLDAAPPPVCVGFGSMPDRDPRRATELVIDALTRAGCRGVVLTGWGGLEAVLASDQIYFLESAPHDWLFPRTAALVHHGGAGTTAAGLRAGVPAVVVPHMADQSFWGRRLFELGAGPRPIPRRDLSARRLAAALRAARDPGPRWQAALLGQRIRAEDGVGRAVEVCERHFGRHRVARWSWAVPPGRRFLTARGGAANGR